VSSFDAAHGGVTTAHMTAAVSGAIDPGGDDAKEKVSNLLHRLGLERHTHAAMLGAELRRQA
jgi:hypothetical protein